MSNLGVFMHFMPLCVCVCVQVTTIAKQLKIGYLPQEPKLDPTKTVHDVVLEGMMVFFSLLFFLKISLSLSLSLSLYLSVCPLSSLFLSARTYTHMRMWGWFWVVYVCGYFRQGCRKK